MINIKKCFKVLLFVFLLLLSVIEFIPSVYQVISLWKGVLISKFAIPALIYYIYFTATLIVINIVYILFFIIKKSSFWKISIIPLFVIILSFMLPLLTGILPSYEKIIYKRSVELIKTEEFEAMDEFISNQKYFPMISILPKTEYVIIDKIVINLNRKTFGKIPPLGFIGLYYMKGDSIRFNSIDSLFKVNNITINENEFNAMLKHMSKNGISDFYYNEIDNVSPMYMFVSTGLAGTRGIIKNMNNIDIHKKFDTLSYVNKIDSNFIYFRIPSHDF